MMNEIKLNDILKLENLDNVKIRFNKNKQSGKDWNPIELFKSGNIQGLLGGQYWNYRKHKSFKVGQITIGFAKVDKNEDLWLLFHVGKVVKDLDIFNSGIGYEYETLFEYEKYFGRLIVKFKNTSQNMIRYAESVIEDCEVVQILPGIFDCDIFPGYEKVNISWKELSRVIEKESWRTALQNQKGVYLITDVSNGKMYVGSAYGENMLLGRWESYKKTGHGGNVELMNLPIDHIKANFRYSILDIYKSTIDDNVIIARESWWKDTLLTRKFGYNVN